MTTAIAPVQATWGELLGVLRRRKGLSGSTAADTISRQVEKVEKRTLYRLEEETGPPTSVKRQRLAWYLLTMLGENPEDWGLDEGCLPEVLRRIDLAGILNADRVDADKTAYLLCAA